MRYVDSSGTCCRGENPPTLADKVGIATPIISEEAVGDRKGDLINRAGNLVLGAVLARCAVQVSALKDPHSQGVETGSLPDDIA